MEDEEEEEEEAEVEVEAEVEMERGPGCVFGNTEEEATEEKAGRFSTSVRNPILLWKSRVPPLVFITVDVSENTIARHSAKASHSSRHLCFASSFSRMSRSPADTHPLRSWSLMFVTLCSTHRPRVPAASAISAASVSCGAFVVDEATFDGGPCVVEVLAAVVVVVVVVEAILVFVFVPTTWHCSVGRLNPILAPHSCDVSCMHVLTPPPETRSNPAAQL
jgi:hypothetical protein